MKILLVVVLLLAGCSSMNTPSLSAEQLKQVAADKSVAAVCAKVTGVWGTGTAVVTAIDQKVIVNGSLQVSPDCVVTFNNDSNKPTVIPVGPVVNPR